MGTKVHELIQHMHSLLNDSCTEPSVPDYLQDIEGIHDIDQSLRNFKHSFNNMQEKLKQTQNEVSEVKTDVNEAQNLFDLFLKLFQMRY